MDIGVAVAEAMNAQAAAKRGVLGRNAMLLQGLDDGIALRLTDAAFGMGAAGDGLRGIIETVEGAVTAVAIDPGYVKNTERRGFVAASTDFGSAPAADGNIAETGQDLIACGKNRQGQRPGIHLNPGLRGLSPAGCGRPQAGCDNQGDEPMFEGLRDLPMKMPCFPGAANAVRILFSLHILLLACWISPARSATFVLPTDGSNIVGQLQVVTADARNTLLDIGRHYELGYEEITLANPGVSVWLPGEGTAIVVPGKFILPPPPWTGIIVNIPQRRLFYFPRRTGKQPATVVTFPIGIARPGWPTPLGTTRITGKHKDPAWFVPKSIQAEQHSQGELDFPEYFPPGPNNPMGMLALETGFAKIFIHGTNRPWGVGMRVSHGCLHLYPEHAADFFAQIAVGTPVRFINQAVLAGARDGQLYLSVFEPVDGYPESQVSLLAQAMDALAIHDAPVDWKRVEQAIDAKRVVPMPVSVGAPSLDESLARIQPAQYDFEPYGIEANDAMPPDMPRRPVTDAPAAP